MMFSFKNNKRKCEKNEKKEGKIQDIPSLPNYKTPGGKDSDNLFCRINQGL